MVWLKIVFLLLSIPAVILFWKIFQYTCEHIWENDEPGYIRCRKCRKRMPIED